MHDLSHHQHRMFFIFSIALITILTACGSKDNVKKNLRLTGAFSPTLINNSDIRLDSTRLFADIATGPKGTISYIVVDSLQRNNLDAKVADDIFKELVNHITDTIASTTFSRYGILVYANTRDSVVQLRVGTQLDDYMSLKGITRGAEYLRLQKLALQAGIDTVCPLMMQHAWAASAKYNDMPWYDRLKTKMGVTWLNDFLYNIGRPSDSITGQISMRVARLVSTICGNTHSVLITVVLLTILLLVINTIIDSVFNKATTEQEQTMLIGHTLGLGYIVKAIISTAIIVPSVSTFTYFSNMRMEDILYLKAINMPYVEIIDWSSWSLPSVPMWLIVILLTLLYFGSYILSPHRLMAYYYCNRRTYNSYALCQHNKYLLRQCVDIEGRGKWEFRVFIGFFLVTVGLQFIIIIATVGIGGLVLLVKEHIFNSDSDNSDDTDYGVTTKGAAVDLDVSTKSDNDDNDAKRDFLKYLVAAGISKKVIKKLPSDFYLYPIEHSAQTVIFEGTILSVVMLISGILILGKAFAAFLMLCYLVKFLYSLIKENNFANWYNDNLYCPLARATGHRVFPRRILSIGRILVFIISIAAALLICYFGGTFGYGLVSQFDIVWLRYIFTIVIVIVLFYAMYITSLQINEIYRKRQSSVWRNPFDKYSIPAGCIYICLAILSAFVLMPSTSLRAIEQNGKFGIGYNSNKMLVEAQYDSIQHNPETMGLQWLVYSEGKVSVAYVSKNATSVCRNFYNRCLRIVPSGTAILGDSLCWYIVHNGDIVNERPYTKVTWADDDNGAGALIVCDKYWGYHLLYADGQPVNSRTYTSITFTSDSTIRAVRPSGSRKRSSRRSSARRSSTLTFYFDRYGNLIE